MYTTCVIWLAFVPLYFGTANHVPLRLTSMSVTISLSASVTVACLFSPKVSNLVFIPQNKLLFIQQIIFSVDCGPVLDKSTAFYSLSILACTQFLDAISFSCALWVLKCFLIFTLNEKGTKKKL